MDIFEQIYESAPDEVTTTPQPARGQVPAGLRGTLLRSGPGLLRVGSDPLNFFDGHASIAGLSFTDAGCVFRYRLVRTPLLEEERAAGGMTRRRTFTNLPRRWANLGVTNLGNPAMHDVYAFGGRVFAGNDPGHFALDARTLDTLGPERWGAERGWEQSPMPSVDPGTGRLVGWLKQVGQTRPDRLCFVELDADLRVVHRTATHALDTSPAILHDQRATERWYVATEQAPRLSPVRALWGAASLYECFVWPPHAGADLLLVPRPGGDRLVRVPLPISVAFHVINAYDDGDRLVVDLCTYDGKIPFSAAAPAALRERLGIGAVRTPTPTATRFVVDPAAGKVLEHHALGAGAFEAPEVPDDRMGRRHRFAYGATHVASAAPDPGSFVTFDGIAKLDCDTGARTTWSAGARAVCSPPAFVRGGPGEDEGHLLAWVLDETGASVVILDARSLEAGPVATIPVGRHLPGVSHVRWAPDVTLDPPS
jgi:beta,beta-carotene 9',10'-dioxygenase